MDKTKLIRLLKATLISIVFGIATMLLLLIVFSVVMAKIGFNNTAATIITIIISMVGGFSVGYSNSLFLKEKGLLVGLLSGIILAFLMFLLKITLFNEPTTYITFVKLMFLIVSSMFGGVIGVNKKTKNKYEKVKPSRL